MKDHSFLINLRDEGTFPLVPFTKFQSYQDDAHAGASGKGKK